MKLDLDLALMKAPKVSPGFASCRREGSQTNGDQEFLLEKASEYRECFFEVPPLHVKKETK